MIRDLTIAAGIGVIGAAAICIGLVEAINHFGWGIGAI